MGRDGFPDAEQHGLCPFHLLRAHHTQWCAEGRIHLFVDTCMHCAEEQVTAVSHFLDNTCSGCSGIVCHCVRSDVVWGITRAQTS